MFLSGHADVVLVDVGAGHRRSSVEVFSPFFDFISVLKPRPLSFSETQFGDFSLGFWRRSFRTSVFFFDAFHFLFCFLYIFSCTFLCSYDVNVFFCFHESIVFIFWEWGGDHLSQL